MRTVNNFKKNRSRNLGAIIWGLVPQRLSPADLKEIQTHEQDTQRILTVLEGNDHILSCLREFYKDLVESHPDLFSNRLWHSDVTKFCKSLDATHSHFKRLTIQADRILKLSADHKSLVRA
jgi:hypothetical protein